MKRTSTDLPDVVLIEPRIFGDARGYFLETWNAERYAALGLPKTMSQDNVSHSVKGVLRGLHYQLPGAQGKLVYVLEGEIFDVAVDIRLGSPTFGRWTGMTLSAADHRQLYIPEGFAHGFCVTSDAALVAYKCTTVYRADCDRGIRWNDPTLSIDWPVNDPLLSPKDAVLPLLDDVPHDLLPRYGAGR